MKVKRHSCTTVKWSSRRHPELRAVVHVDHDEKESSYTVYVGENRFIYGRMKGGFSGGDVGTEIEMALGAMEDTSELLDKLKASGVKFTLGRKE